MNQQKTASLSLAQYSIYIGNMEEAWQQFLAQNKYTHYLVLVDENTASDCLPRLTTMTPGAIALQTIVIPAGEIHKNLETCTQIWEQMMEAGCTRNSLLINLGGGVIGDMGGFCASTYKRGIDFVQIPTTLLSQVDASIGGKLGIDFRQIKNSIGVFNDPKAVFVDVAWLRTLSPREVRSGFAEIAKHSLIADAQQWEKLKDLDGIDQLSWEDFLAPSLRIKQRIVEEDPFEKGIRKALNFGHTIGHGIEGHLLDTASHLLHGEAIAIGMVCEAWLSYKQTGLSAQELEDITGFFIRIYGHVELQPEDDEAFIVLMGNDKKNEDTRINFTLLNKAGEAAINHTATPSEIRESLHYYRSIRK